MKPFKFLYFAALLTLVSCATEIVDLTGAVSGTVKDAGDFRLLDGCIVSLEPGGSSQTTGTDGYFSFENLDPGKYTITVKKSGYKDVVKEIQIVTGKYLQTDILLEIKDVFSFSQDQLNFGDLDEVITFYVLNNSDNNCSFRVTNVPSWLTVTPDAGTVNNGSSKLITATLDRSAEDYGKHSHTLVFDYEGSKSGQATLPVKFEKVELSAPKVSCLKEAENVTQNSFVIKGNILSTGGSKIIRHGHCWSTVENPTVDDSCNDLGATTSVYEFMTTVNGLDIATKYYVRAYAENAQGISYSEQVVVMTEDVKSDKWDGKKAKEFAAGNGSKSNPYRIRTGGQLLHIMDMDGESNYYKLDNNIDLDNRNWKPFEFNGVLEGNGYMISNLMIDHDDMGSIGLFSEITGTVKDLTIKNVYISNESSSDIGALAGALSNGAIENCHVIFTSESRMYGTGNVAGLVGCTDGNSYDMIENKITGCSVISHDNDFMIDGNKAAGICAWAPYGKSLQVSGCHVVCNINGEEYSGGIVGNAYGANDSYKIELSSYKGTLSGQNYVAGISAYHAQIIACKADVVIESGQKTAGICNSSSGQSVKASYSTGKITEGTCYPINGGKNCLSYSTIVSGYTKDCYHVSQYDDIATKMNDEFSDYADYWNFDNTWVWKGVIDGKSKEVICPRLSWE